MPAGRDPLRIFLQVGLFVFFYLLFLLATGFLVWGVGYLAGVTLSGFLAALGANLVALRIYEGGRLTEIGFPWNRAAARNIGLGLLGGATSAALVMALPLASRAAVIVPLATSEANVRTLLYVSVMLFCGAAGEEMLFRGYGFQILLRSFGPYATILPVGVLFAALHYTNPHASALGLVNTAGFGMIFGYAFLRSRDLWLPIGLHFGWNVTLPLFGANVSGITIRVTSYALQWNAGPLWSGGEYGPEASLLTSAVLFALFAFVRMAPVGRQQNPLIDGLVES
ncbi:MAG: CPBP family intramembrane metalloprotease [Candidatus Solibacter usitatus]|nr:CPBP family intramembrane metalloprotease [Candidatus Solibacter usitatus]